MVPSMSQHDADHVPWSRHQLRLRKGEHVYTYHNYTNMEAQEDQGTLGGVRYLRRETIPYYDRMIRTHVHDGAGATMDHLHQTRGMIINPNIPSAEVQPIPDGYVRYVAWKWKQNPNARCKQIIPLCFADKFVRDEVRPVAEQAIQM